MHTTDSFYHHKIVLLTQDTEGSYDGRHSHGRPYGSCSRKRCYGESKDIGTDFCHRIMAFSHFSQSRSIRLSLGRSRDPCFNRLHDAHIDPPLTQTHDKRSGDECFPTPVSVAVIKIPRVLESWACRLVRRIVWDLAGCKKLLVRLEKQNSPLQDAQKVQTSHPPNPGAPKRALSRARVFRLLIPLLRGVAKAALYCAHRATTASSWGLCEQEAPGRS